jgi:septal ring factor EnvC (AmiA/AmiB activator)
MPINVNTIGLLVFAAMLFAVCSCDTKPKESGAQFTKADSLTERYLALQDSMLQVWNTMMHDDNLKIKAMHQLLNELSASNPEKQDDLRLFRERLEHLEASRYDQNTMADTEIVTEYDFASNSLVTELISMAESQDRFAYNDNLQKLVDDIRAADQRVNNYREEYDRTAAKYNNFLDDNREWLREIEKDSLEKKPLFQMAAE